MIAAAGVMHGLFELLQGGTPSGLVVNAIGPDQRMWPHAGLHAFTLVPSFTITGVMAITVGLAATIWAVFFVDTRSGPWIMLGLFVALFLVGGGFGPIGVGIPVSLVATRIGRPLRWWRRHLSRGTGDALAALWPWSLVAYVVLFVASVATTISGWPVTLVIDDATAQAVVLQAGYVLLAVMVVAIVAAFAHDVRTSVLPDAADPGPRAVRRTLTAAR
jgi:hypothetical protein